MSRIERNLWIAAPLLAALVGPPLLAGGGTDPPKAGASSPDEPRGHGNLAVVLRTGPEDLQTVNMAIRHAAMARKSGYLDDVVLLVYGRGIQAFARDVTAKPRRLA